MSWFPSTDLLLLKKERTYDKNTKIYIYVYVKITLFYILRTENKNNSIKKFHESWNNKPTVYYQRYIHEQIFSFFREV